MSRRPSLYSRIKIILESARAGISRTVNTTQVIANWLVGREIVEEEQQGKRRASYGKREIAALSKRLQAKFGEGYSVQNLSYMRQFYLTYPDLVESSPILHAPRGKSLIKAARFQDEIFHAMRGISTEVSGRALHPGRLNPACHGPIIERYCAWKNKKRGRFTRLKRRKTTGRLVSWNVRSPACYMNDLPLARIKKGL